MMILPSGPGWTVFILPRITNLPAEINGPNVK